MAAGSFWPLAFFNLSPTELIIIAIVALLLFGHRLPQVARAAGQSIVEFKKGLRDVGEEVDKASKEKEETPDKDEEKKA